MGKASLVCCLALTLTIGGVIGRCAEKQARTKRPTRAQIRRMIKDLNGLPSEQRKAKIKEFYEKYGRPMRQALTKAKYQPGKTDENTKVFVFKNVPGRGLKIYVDFPPDWKKTDRRSPQGVPRTAIVFWHGGGFTQGGASQFYAQAKYFNQRGMVVARPEYRVRDIDGTMPHKALEDAISAMRWFKQRADEFGIDPDRIAVGGGSAGGHLSAAMGTVDAKALAAMGHVGAEDEQSISIRPCAMVLFNPFVDFFEPLNERHLEEECLMNGRDPADMEKLYHLGSPIEHVSRNTPPNIILFGTKDAFYPQQIRWIVKCRELGLTIHDYVYKGEVHSWYNNSPHLEYTTENVDKFLVEIGLLKEEPKVELPHKVINPNRAKIQEDQYAKKTDWDEQERFQRYIKQHNIRLIPYKHYENK